MGEALKSIYANRFADSDYLPYLRERLAAFPGLTAVRLWRELRERGYAERLPRRAASS